MLKHGLSLKRFILRTEVLRLYREALSVARLAPDTSTKQEIQSEVRNQFRMHLTEDREEQIKYLLSDGRTKIKKLAEMMECAK
mmetsp:Transcript_26463/g.43312  ORF Transcript_26463/g.43312 Transcript_26463/m.43312 type:complete len:83 (-) Transcript_26463:229-477(-)